MEKRILGNTKIEISPVGLGCMGLSHAFGTPLEKAEAADKIQAAYDMGYTFFDTAECYTGTNPDGTTAYNEEAVGQGIKSFRDKIVLATKCGVAFSDKGMLLDSGPAAIRKAIEGSLRRLQTDYIDLYYQHRVDSKVEPEVVAETIAQVCLGWMISKKPWIVPIPGTRSPERMKENLASADVTLSAEDIAKLDEALNKMNLADAAATRTNTPKISE